MVVAVNKMDDKDVDFAEARFADVKKDVGGFLKKCGFNPDKVPFVPVSGWTGDNLVDKSPKMPWYEGPTLIEALGAIEPPARLAAKPLRVPIQDVYNVGSAGTVLAGRVETGALKPGDSVTISPGNITTEVKSIESHKVTLNEAAPGDNIGFSVKNVAMGDVHRGSVVSLSDNDPAKEAESFTAQVVVLNHPGRITAGYTPVVDCHTSHVSVRFAELIAKVDRKTGKEIERNPAFIKTGDACICKLVPMNPMCVETYAEYPPMGRFAVRDSRQVVAVGIIKSVEKKDAARAKQPAKQ